MTYIAGQPWFICDRCAEQRRISDRRKEWSGLIVCPPCLDPKPAEMTPPRIYPEGLPIRDARPEPPVIEVPQAIQDNLSGAILASDGSPIYAVT